MNKGKSTFNIPNVLIILLLLIVTMCGIGSFHTSYSYEIVNQYGENVRMWGAGLYAHDSYFKAPIFIGSDFTILTDVLKKESWSFKIKTSSTGIFKTSIMVLVVNGA